MLRQVLKDPPAAPKEPLVAPKVPKTKPGDHLESPNELPLALVGAIWLYLVTRSGPNYPSGLSWGSFSGPFWSKMLPKGHQRIPNEPQWLPKWLPKLPKELKTDPAQDLF